MVLDFLIGASFITGFGIIKSKTDFPDYLLTWTLGLGLFQVVIALILLVGLGRPKYGEGVCDITSFAEVFAILAAIGSAFAGLAFSVSGQKMLRNNVQKMVKILLFLRNMRVLRSGLSHAILMGGWRRSKYQTHSWMRLKVREFCNFS